jgi:CRISPR-associated protein Csd1
MSSLAGLVRAYDRMAARNEVPAFGYSVEKIGFAIPLNDDGTIVGRPIDLRALDGKKKFPVPMAVPASFKRPGVTPKAFFLWDNTAFVLGVTASEGKDAVVRFQAFRDRHLRDLAGTDDEGVVALRRFLEAWNPDDFGRLGWPEDMKDQNIVFALERERLDNIYIHDRPAARELWARLSQVQDDQIVSCLVSGKKEPIARIHPAIKGVRAAGASKDSDSIVSFNQPSFESYGHVQGHNAQIGHLSAFKYVAALNRFLERDSRHRIQIGDASTVFWADSGDPKAAEEAEDIFAGLIGVDDEKIAHRGVKDTLEKIRAGRATDIIADLPKGVRFYILGLAPNAARLSIRFYLEDEFGVIARRYLEHVERLRIEPPPREAAPSMWRMLVETAVLRKSENIQPNLAGEWLRAILSGTPYPLTLLSTLIMRLRADHDVNALRVAMLKSVLAKNFDMEVPVALDPACTDQGYLLGRLFALYERVQTSALGRNVNASIKDKYYGAASAQPRKIFHLLESGSANHLSKIDKQKPGLKVILEKQIGAIMDLMEPLRDPFPASLPEKSQALFGLGYYHQRNEFFRTADKSTPEDAAA